MRQGFHVLRVDTVQLFDILEDLIELMGESLFFGIVEIQVRQAGDMFDILQ